MFISKLNKIFQKHGKIMFIILTLIIAIPFVFYFSGMQEGILSIFTKNDNTTQKPIKIKIDNKRINRKMIADSVNNLLINYVVTQKMDEKNIANNVNAIFKNRIKFEIDIIQQAIEHILIIHEIGKKHKDIKVTEQEIERHISILPIFTDENNNFSNKKYELLIDILEDFDIDEEKFKDYLKKQLLILKFQSKLTQDINVTKKEIKDLYNLYNKNYTIKIYQCNIDELTKNIDINKDEIIKFYEQNIENYKFNNQSKAIAMIFDNNSLDSKNKNPKSEANEFLTDIYNKFYENNTNINSLNNNEIKTEFIKYAKKNKKQLVSIDKWINEKTRSIDQIGKNNNIAKEISNINIEMPLSDVLKIDDNKFCVILLTDRKDIKPNKNINKNENISYLINEIKEDYIIKNMINSNMIKNKSLKTRTINFTLLNKKENLCKKYKQNCEKILKAVEKIDNKNKISKPIKIDENNIIAVQLVKVKNPSKISEQQEKKYEKIIKIKKSKDALIEITKQYK